MADFYSDHEWIFTYGGFKLFGLMLFFLVLVAMALVVAIGRFFKWVSGKK